MHVEHDYLCFRHGRSGHRMHFEHDLFALGPPSALLPGPPGREGGARLRLVRGLVRRPTGIQEACPGASEGVVAKGFDGSPTSGVGATTVGAERERQASPQRLWRHRGGRLARYGGEPGSRV